MRPLETQNGYLYKRQRRDELQMPKYLTKVLHILIFNTKHALQMTHKLFDICIDCK